MIGFPVPREEQAKHYDFIRKQTHDSDSQEWEFPAQYMFKGVPHYDRVDDPVEMLMAKMNQHGITKALTGMAVDGNAKIALERYPDRFVASTNTDPNQGMDAVRKLDEDVRVHGAKADELLGHRPDPAGAAERQEDVPDLFEVHRARHPDLRLRRRARSAHPLRAAGSRCSTRCAGSSPSSRSSRATAASRGAS